VSTGGAPADRGTSPPEVLVLEEGRPELAPSTDLAGLHAALAAHQPADAQQAEVQARMVAFAAAHPDALHRRCAEGHFTGSALVVDHARQQVLVLLHAKLGRWLQPGGHTDGEANLARTALREATEETGITGLRVVVPAVDLDIHEVRPPREAPHAHLDVRYLVLAPPGAAPAGNHESHALRWVGEDELPGLGADDGLVRLAARGLALARSLPADP
jgi:8-oxo-dGTP pyrophosphatase MutT (NUDIX family)